MVNQCRKFMRKARIGWVQEVSGKLLQEVYEESKKRKGAKHYTKIFKNTQG